MSPPRERNDRSKPIAKGFDKPRARGFSGPREGGSAHPADEARGAGGLKAGSRRRGTDINHDWVWGWHAVRAALANPARTGLRRLVVNSARAPEIEGQAAAAGLRVERVGPGDIGNMLPAGAVHQGVALLADPPEPVALEDLAERGPGMLVMLDQVTDPQNVGAIFRSAAAFGARGVILQDRHAPALSGALAKAAAGAIDHVPHARVVNLSRALESLAEAGWRAVGLDGSAPGALADVLDRRPTVLVLGSEGEGIRRLVSEHCDALARIPMPGGSESLNVSSAAAVALYAVYQAQI